ncbi:MAG: exopolyphosphatase, partial [Acidimicrobiia bacterium]|nr:exopolyphosphatase [Acidimicrobiia bacterium]
MKVGAIDIGTNTVRLLVAERVGGGLFPVRLEDLDRRVVITRLGEGVDGSGRLADAAILRTVEVLGAYGAALRAWNVDVVDAVATSATRDAANRDVLLERAELALGFRPRVISGDDEAALSFNGATIAGDTGLHLVIDPGGGSTEFVSGVDRVEQSISVEIGSVRLTERLLP